MKQLIILYFIFSSIAVNAQEKIRYTDPAQEAHKGETFDVSESGLNNSLINERISKKIDSIKDNQTPEEKIILAKLIAKANKEAEKRIVKEQNEIEVKKKIDALKKIEVQKVLEGKERNRNVTIVVGIGILLMLLFYLTRTITKLFKTKQMGSTIKNTLRTYSFENLQSALIKNKFKNLSKEEIIVVAIVIGTLMAILLGYVFGETQYFVSDGRRIYDADWSEKNNFEKHYAFNYVIGIASFLIFSGISFLYLSRSKTNTEHREIVNAKADDVNEPKVELKEENKDASKYIPSFEEGTMDEFSNL